MCKNGSVIHKSICKGVLQVIILLAQFTDYKYNSYKILRFSTGGYIGTSGDDFHILNR